MRRQARARLHRRPAVRRRCRSPQRRVADRRTRLRVQLVAARRRTGRWLAAECGVHRAARPHRCRLRPVRRGLAAL